MNAPTNPLPSWEQLTSDIARIDPSTRRLFVDVDTTRYQVVIGVRSNVSGQPHPILSTVGSSGVVSASGESLLSAHYIAQVAGAQPVIRKTNARLYVVFVNGEALTEGIDFTYDAQGNLTINPGSNADSKARPIEGGEMIQYYWVTGPITSAPDTGYSDAEIDDFLSLKADKATTYLRSEINTFLFRKQDAFHASSVIGSSTTNLNNFQINEVIVNSHATFISSTTATLTLPVLDEDIGAPCQTALYNAGTTTLTFKGRLGQVVAVLAPGERVLLYATVLGVLGSNPPQTYFDFVNVAADRAGFTQAQIAYVKALAAPITALVSGIPVGFQTLEAALAASPVPTTIQLNADITVSNTTVARFGGSLFGNGCKLIIADGAQLRLLRNSSLYNIIASAIGSGAIKIVGAGVPEDSTIPEPLDCVQVIDSVLDLPLNFDAASNFQGLAIRGNSIVTNINSGGGPVYLYDLASLTLPVPADFIVLDQRPAKAGVFSYAARRYENAPKVQLQNVYYYGIPCTMTLPGSAASYTTGASGFMITESGFYGLKGHAHMVFPNLNVYSECFFYLNNDGGQLITFSQITPRDAGGGLILGTEQLAVDVYLPANTTVHLGYSDSTAGSMYPRNDAPAISCKMSIIRLA